LCAKIESAGNSIIKCDVPQIINGKKSLYRVEFYRATPGNYGILKLIRTGSAHHNEYLATLALSKGMRLKYSEGLMQGENVLAGAEETEVFRALGLEFVEPQDREVVNGKPVWMK
jgi:DNA polymerase/3'-5' exonuclease PolX